MLGIDFFIEICTCHRKSPKNVDLNTCALDTQVVSLELAVPVLTFVSAEENYLVWSNIRT